jgi:ribonuclease HI
VVVVTFCSYAENINIFNGIRVVKERVLCGMAQTGKLGTLQLTYAWGLGESTNNKVESLALFQGLNILKSKKIRSLIVINNSLVIIQQM